MPRRHALAILVLAAATAGCGANGREPAEVTEVADLMAGRFDNIERNEGVANHRNLQISAVEVPGAPAGGHWVYMEQASFESPHLPFDQRLFRIRAAEPGEDAAVVAESFVMPGMRGLAQGWLNGALAKADLAKAVPRAGCNLYLRDEGDAWHGGTRGTDCASKRSPDTRYAELEVWIRGDGLRTRERGFDAEGKELWGPAEPYVFDRRGEIEFGTPMKPGGAAPAAPATEVPAGAETPAAPASPAPPKPSDAGG